MINVLGNKDFNLSVFTRKSFSLFLLGKKVLGFFLGGVFLSLDFKFGLLLIELHEFGEIELGLLKELDLSHKHVLEGEDLTALSLDFFANRVRNTKDIINK